jgi:filamentous hemagglutinin
VPTTGKAVGDVRIDEEQLQTANIVFTDDSNPTTDIEGGGNLFVDVGGDIRGGVYYVGEGAAKLRAGGSIGAQEGRVAAPIVALGDATFDVQARTDLALETVLNPSIIRTDRQPTGARIDGFFFSYGEDSSVNLRSLAGDVVLNNRLTAITDDYNVTTLVGQEAMGVYPGNVLAHSYVGDTKIDRVMTLFPTPTGRLEIVAGGDLITSGSALINQSDADPALLPSIATPLLTEPEINVALARLQPQDRTAHAATPVHRGDFTSNLIAVDGSIGSEGDALSLFLAKQSGIFAGEDIESFALRIQHNNPDDVSVLSAGGDIRQPTLRTPSGSFQPEAGPGARIIEIGGGGRFDMLAGGTIDFGTSLGLRSVGDTANAALADSGATLTVMAGLGKAGADWSAFSTRYLVPSGKYASKLATYLEPFDTNPALTALENFRQLPLEKQRPFLLDVFFTELRDAGVKGAGTQQLEDYEPGFEAIKVLFPGDDRKGDLVSLLSQITTIDGGGINLLVPGGLVNAGVASASIVVKSPEELGIVAQRDGDINAFVRDDFIVNQSRVFALDGGDITVWSSKGDIDAGRGAKTALAVPPPTVSFDAEGNLIVEFPPAIAGSGIRGAVSTPGRPPGDVYLFAPAGVVDAGDAGIGSAGNITIGATEVIGADNIDVGGVSIGIPVDTGGIAAGLANVSSVSSSATSSATEELGGDSTPEEPAVLADSALSWLEVFVIGLGEENCRPDDAACLQRSQKPE